jgi:hypothetical protein
MFWWYAAGILMPLFCGYGGTSVENQQSDNYPKDKKVQLFKMTAVPVVFGFI